MSKLQIERNGMRYFISKPKTRALLALEDKCLSLSGGFDIVGYCAEVLKLHTAPQTSFKEFYGIEQEYCLHFNGKVMTVVISNPVEDMTKLCKAFRIVPETGEVKFERLTLLDMAVELAKEEIDLDELSMSEVNEIVSQLMEILPVSAVMEDFGKFQELFTA